MTTAYFVTTSLSHREWADGVQELDGLRDDMPDAGAGQNVAFAFEPNCFVVHLGALISRWAWPDATA